ncbi:hypothetical protein PROFUN_01761 [Planoprotostelium fungivorum]|uniref:ABC transporter domain-containing protein n=1 Tax=Planoprotostelium fungivorum TaxID=1890364 RepID=A0A2P6MWG9_9EUKA|nr:hypothetical protein PROFUN_01761 [Planoprotostelium fungivorum]
MEEEDGLRPQEIPSSPLIVKTTAQVETHTTIDFNEDQYYGNTRVAKSDPHADDPDTLVYMKNVHKTYLLGIEGVPALRGVDLVIKRGEFVVIFGTSGGGKTTMLNILGTIDKPTKGELRLAGTRTFFLIRPPLMVTGVTSNTKDSELSNIRLQKIGFVFQTFNLLASLSAVENVEMPMILNGVLSTEDRRNRARELLAKVGMEPRMNHVPSQLSGGEQQRVTIARAIANSPEILLLDEPTGDLDTVNTHLVMKLLADLNREEKITMIMVTHDVALKQFADRVIWMRDGKIQRIEMCDPKKKSDAIAKNEAELQEARRKREESQKRQGPPVTEFRKPTDYNTHPGYGAVRPSQVKREVKEELVSLSPPQRTRENFPV